MATRAHIHDNPQPLEVMDSDLRRHIAEIHKAEDCQKRRAVGALYAKKQNVALVLKLAHYFQDGADDGVGRIWVAFHKLVRVHVVDVHEGLHPLIGT